jgi:hypothetical protein
MVCVVTGPFGWFLHTNNTVFTAFLVRLENMNFSSLCLHFVGAIQMSQCVMYMLLDNKEIKIGFAKEFL